VPTRPEAEIRSAIENDELTLHYQPILNLRTGAVDAYEALARWQPPGAALRPPSEFVPVAEQSDLICDLDTWVLDEAARQIAVWNRTFPVGPVIAVNVSGGHVNRSRIRDDVTTVLHRHAIEPGQLVLEITETVAVDDGQALDNLHELRRLGVVLSLDDFGAGHSSLDQLSRLPLDSVKIDRSFLDTATPSARATLQQMVRTAHSFGLTVVGEGVERTDQLTLLRSLQVESAQGFLIGPPMPPEALATHYGQVYGPS
jgi:EAL domain-containing protein (putative c-di-GMP-specific phosphodiesterase class I)